LQEPVEMWTSVVGKGHNALVSCLHYQFSHQSKGVDPTGCWVFKPPESMSEGQSVF